MEVDDDSALKMPIASRRMTPDQRQLFGYAVATFGLRCLNSVFALYTTEVFLRIYNLDVQWFYYTQLLYSLWNAINDPLFGWLQDGGQGARRAPAILRGGPFLAISFMLPWLPLSDPASPVSVGLHYMASLSLYDAAFTWTALAHCSLFADIQLSSDTNRSSLQRVSDAGSMLGCLPVLLSRAVFDRTNMTSFTLLMVVLAAFSAACLIYAGCMLKERPNRIVIPQNCREHDKELEGDSKDPPLRLFISQICRQTSFWAFVIVNFIQLCNIAINDSFYVLFSDVLIGPKAVSTTTQSVVLGATEVSTLCLLK